MLGHTKNHFGVMKTWWMGINSVEQVTCCKLDEYVFKQCKNKLRVVNWTKMALNSVRASYVLQTGRRWL